MERTPVRTPIDRRRAPKEADLMLGLLPQPGGFEGLGLAREGLQRTHFFWRHSPTCQMVPSMDAPLAMPCPADARPHNGYVAEFSSVLDLCTEVGGNAEHALPPASNTVMAAEGVPALQRPDAREVLDVGVGKREGGSEVAPVRGPRSLGRPAPRSPATSPTQYPPIRAGGALSPRRD